MTLSPPASSPIAPARREPTQWPLFMVVGLVALGALTWVLRPDLLGPATNTAQPTASKAVDGGEKPGAKFADLYEHYGMAPIDAAIAASPAVDPVLASLQREPCDRQLVYKADLALEKAHATRAAAELLRGVGSLCADAQGELYRASELFLSLGASTPLLARAATSFNANPTHSEHITCTRSRNRAATTTRRRSSTLSLSFESCPI